MALRSVILVAAIACVNMAAARPKAPCYPCPRPLPEIHPVVFQSIIPAPVNIGPFAPGVVEHTSYPIELNYFEKPWVVKHLKSAALNVFTEHPVVVDEYAPPHFNEAPAHPAVIVEEVCGAPVSVAPPCNAGCGGGCGGGCCGGYGSGYAGYGAPGYAY